MLDEIRDIVEALLAKARARQIKWGTARDLGIASAGSDDFIITFPDYAINVYRTEEDDFIGFSILNSMGETIFYKQFSPGDHLYHELSEILDLAGWQSKNVDGALDYLRRALRQGGAIGGA